MHLNMLPYKSPFYSMHSIRNVILPIQTHGCKVDAILLLKPIYLKTVAKEQTDNLKSLINNGGCLPFISLFNDITKIDYLI